jgi:hypothetical protein
MERTSARLRSMHEVAPQAGAPILDLSGHDCPVHLALVQFNRGLGSLIELSKL